MAASRTVGVRLIEKPLLNDTLFSASFSVHPLRAG
jgi:hypothetical protein